jgi:predicted metalloprotease
MPLPIRPNQQPPVPKYRTLRETYGTSQVDAPRTWGARTWGVLLSIVVILLLVVVVLLRHLLLDIVVLLCLVRRLAPPLLLLS